MPMLPYVLCDLHDLAAAMDGRHYGHGFDPRWERDSYGLLDDLLTYRAPSHTVLRLLDQHAPEHGVQHAPARIVLRPGHLLQRRLSAPARRAQELLERKQKLAKEKKDDGLLISVDVQQFRPEELSVQVLKDEGYVVVEGKHEERPDEHGFVQRQFTRRYKLPANVDPDTVTSKLTSDGVLQVSAPRKEALPAPKENVRHVTITHTDRPAVKDAAEEASATVATNDKEMEKEDVGKEKVELHGEDQAEVIGA